MTSSERIAAALAMAMASFASMALVGPVGVAKAGLVQRTTDCEDGDCDTGNIPSEGPNLFDSAEGDDESGSDSEGGGFDDADDSDDAAESDSGSEGGAAPSDRRLKRDIRLLITLDNGIRLYAFRYLWSEETHVGVMAQDLLADARYADAVMTASSGTYMVDYGRLGLRMATLGAWHAHGLEAVMLRARPENRPASHAATAH